MLENMESRITFEVPSSLDFDKLIRDNNYTLFWQNLHSEPFRSGSSSTNHNRDNPLVALDEEQSAAAVVHQGDRNSSDFNLMSSLQHFAGARSGGYGWGVLGSGSGGSGGGSANNGMSELEGPLVDPSYLWIGAVMVLLILSGLFCVCSCYLYYKYRRWQKCVSMATCQTLASMDIEAPPAYDVETLPSYTIASGLPSYEDAVRHQSRQHPPHSSGAYEPAQKLCPATTNTTIHPPAVVRFFESRPQNWLNVAIFEEIHYNFVGRGTSITDVGGYGQSEASKAMAITTDRVDRNKPENDSGGPFRVDICVLENEKDDISCHR